MAEYARIGCPITMGRDWTPAEMEVAAQRGPHVSSLEPDAIEQIQVEARDKEKQGFAKIYKCDDVIQNPPPNLKLSPLAMIPHKSRKYRAILDLLFELRVAGYQLPSVNDATSSTEDN